MHHAFALACVFTAGWVRGYCVADVVNFGNGESATLHSLRLCRNGILWEWSGSEDALGGHIVYIPWWSCHPPANATDRLREWESIVQTVDDWRFQSSGFDIGEFHDRDDPKFRVKWRVIPYWSIVVPTTLLSVWLLLSKPKQLQSVTHEPANQG
jgi:hypothetical protein